MYAELRLDNTHRAAVVGVAYAAVRRRSADRGAKFEEYIEASTATSLLHPPISVADFMHPTNQRTLRG